MFEFLQNDRFDARSVFDAVKPLLRYHNYGYSIGGPVPLFNFGENDGPMFKSGKDKFFFFFGEEWKSIHRFAASSNPTLPTTAELNGDFSVRLTNSVTIPNTTTRVNGFLHDPLIAITPESQYINNANFPIASISACQLIRPPESGSTATPTIPIRTACFTGNFIPTIRVTTDGISIANAYRR